ncbi:DNA cytosine methyltransferase [Collimonas sp.]|uniref:DNA cytosine methyltransferase n=1 Tax=Collimonas sp. TaxID=1963772 RepID=UPI002B9F6D9B|nr:DNA cytosine methyltransferase [Collimonas sp.]HWX02028.1 DNA cytosine methyltransferase [Collimonas sp.]
MAAYYNEHDKGAAQWLRNLITAGHIAAGDVDERDIRDVRPNDIHGYTQCHFFAGVGVWSYALRRAGWSDDRPVWTGSCPCQPFSTAGKGTGFDDERHLWPAFYHLISKHKNWCKRQKRPAPTIFGEQVASKHADAWIDLVQADLEALGYPFGAIPFPSAGVGAPHIRDRIYWVGNADSAGPQRHTWNGGSTRWKGSSRSITTASLSGRMANVYDQRHHGRGKFGGKGSERCGRIHAAGYGNDVGLPGPTNGFWRAADWLGCRDEKFRPVEPGTFPLAHGATARVGRLRAYGNAINAEAAKAFIEAVM